MDETEPDWTLLNSLAASFFKVVKRSLTALGVHPATRIFSCFIPPIVEPRYKAWSRIDRYKSQQSRDESRNWACLRPQPHSRFLSSSE